MKALANQATLQSQKMITRLKKLAQEEHQAEKKIEKIQKDAISIYQAKKRNHEKVTKIKKKKNRFLVILKNLLFSTIDSIKKKSRNSWT